MSILRPWAERLRKTQEWRLSVVTAPADVVATPAELQQHARVLFPGESDPFAGAEDAELAESIEAAVQEIDSPIGWLGRSLINRTLRLSLDANPARIVRLPGPPISAFSQLVYYDTNGDEQTVDAADMAAAGYLWDLDDTGNGALLWSDIWPGMADRPARLKIEYVAGYGADSSSIPGLIRRWVLMRAAELYRDRELSSLAPVKGLEHATRMLDNWRVRIP